MPDVPYVKYTIRLFDSDCKRLFLHFGETSFFVFFFGLPCRIVRENFMELFSFFDKIFRERSVILILAKASGGKMEQLR